MRLLSILILVCAVGCAEPEQQTAVLPTCYPEKEDYCSNLILSIEIEYAEDVIDLFDTNSSECYCNQYLAQQKLYTLEAVDRRQAQAFQKEWELVTGEPLTPNRWR